ncbi:hypothetical protein APICC_08476 [Apis cerana cerana]|uniref:Uncharacterized protein n=1 Tax=Apis cerana cerana TaxID=94128 RepID=A0A2A3ESW7_APICC|nr:hypothetical protein APICC_08476 [Apis cerana cerana]
MSNRNKDLVNINLINSSGSQMQYQTFFGIDVQRKAKDMAYL